MQEAPPIPPFPRPLARLLGGVPLPLVAAVLARLANGLAQRHPSLFERLGPHAGATFLIDPLDLPFALLLRPDQPRARITAIRRAGAPRADARIAGRLAALIGLVHAAYDGDALFFSRDLTIEGDTEAVLALRNAIDNAEIDFSEEWLALAGPLRGLAEAPLRRILPFVERASGVALSRPAPARGWP